MTMSALKLALSTYKYPDQEKVDTTKKIKIPISVEKSLLLPSTVETLITTNEAYFSYCS